MNGRWFFFDPGTGVFAGSSYSGPAEFLGLNTPRGMGVAHALDHIDPLKQMVDLAATARAQAAADAAAAELPPEAPGEAPAPRFIVDPVVVTYQPPAPADTEGETWSWDADLWQWSSTPTLAAAQRSASDAIDAAAGQARLRYITEEPGQQAVYLRKAEQARAYHSAGYAGAVPAYVAAEAQAMELTSQAAAERILAIADAWDDQLSPAIEGLRIGGKNTVSLATTTAAVATALAASLTQLAAI